MELRSAVMLLCLVSLAESAGQRKIYAAGSGLDMFSLPETVQEILTLSGRAKPHLLYLGTATYDNPTAQKTQTQAFLDAGCTVDALEIAVHDVSPSSLRAAFEAADIVLVSGGNTLYAHDRLTKLGVPEFMTEAMGNGTVLCGGSAGGIVWFDGGHSDSMEAASYKNPPGPLLSPNMSKEEMGAWAYIRVPGLSVIPGLFCPHYDMTESNGVLRSADFTGMLQRHAGEEGLGIDNWGALRVDGDSYRIISRQGKPGSVKDGVFTSKRDGVPGAWQMQIDPSNGQLQRSLVPSIGKLSELLHSAKYIVPSNMLGVARAQNPDDGKPPTFPPQGKL